MRRNDDKKNIFFVINKFGYSENRAAKKTGRTSKTLVRPVFWLSLKS